MKRRFLLRGAVFCLSLSAALFAAALLREREEPPRPYPPGAVSSIPWGYGSSMLSSPSVMRFADDRLAEKLRRFNLAVGQADGPQWYYQPFARRPSRSGVFALEAGSFRDPASQGPLNYHGPREARWVQVAAYFNPTEGYGQETVGGIHVHARWKPAGAGWSAEVRYTTYQGRAVPWAEAREHFELHFLRYNEAGPDPVARIVLRRDGGMSYDTLFVADDPAGRTEYRLAVLTYDPEQKPAGPPDDDVLRILSCPEALRDYGLKCCDYLAARVEDEFASGEAVREAIVQVPPDPVRGNIRDPAIPPARVPSDRKLTADEKKRLLDDARRHVRVQAAALARDYRELHAAAQKACPLVECVRPGPP